MVGAIVAPAAPLADWARAAAAPPYWPRETFSGCQLVNIDHDGRPAQDAGALGKRSYGRMAGSVTVAGLIEPRDGVTVCEGLADALSLAARYRPAAIATLGTAGLQAAPTVAALAELGAVAVAGLLGPSVGVCVYPDSDNAGLKASANLCDALGRRGTVGRVVRLADGLDPAAAAARDGWRDVDAATVAACRAIFEADGLPAWECARRAYAKALALAKTFGADHPPAPLTAHADRSPDGR